MKKHTETSLTDILNIYQMDTIRKTNCHAIGRIVSFDSTKQECSVKINYLKTIEIKDTKTGLYKEKSLDYPVLIDCPTIVLSGGKAGITFPIEEGDDCLVLFNDRDIDSWYEGANNAVLSSQRCHSIADGIALVGLKANRNAIEDYDAENAHFFNDQSSIKLKSNKIVIENATYNLGDILKELIDAINAITVPVISLGAPSGVPVNAAAFTAIKLKLEGLLE